MTIGALTKLAKVADKLLDLAQGTGAFALNFLSPLASAVSRTVGDKLGESVSIKDFGAVGDGVTNSVDALLAAGTGTTGNLLIPAGNFVVNATVENSAFVLALLARIRIEGTLTINLLAGTHPFTAPVRMFSGGLKVNGLNILGAAPVAVSITSQVSVSGVAGAYSVVLAVASVAGIAVGDFLHTHTVAGTGIPEVHRGMWEITVVDSVNNRLTVNNTCRKATFPTNTITSSTSLALKTVLKFADCDGFVVVGSRIDFLNNVAIVGNSDNYWSSANISGTEKGTHGMVIGSQTIALNGKADNSNQYGVSHGHVTCGPNVGINGFDQQGVVTELGGTLWADFLSLCNNKRRGMYASTSSGVRAKHISANGNYLDGVICDLGGDIYSSSVSCAVGNGARGISASQNGTIVFDTGVISANGSDGAAGVLGGTIQATSARYEQNVFSAVLGEYGGVLIVNNSIMDANGRYGVDADFGSTARALSCTITNNGLHGIRATEGSAVVASSSTYTGNVSGDKTVRGGGIILDGSAYTLEDRLALSFKSIQGTAGQGVRLTSTSGGDDCQIQHDTTGAGTYTTTFHMRSGTGGLYPQTDNTVILGRASERWSQVFAGIGTINTSDAREKTEVSALTDIEMQAAVALGKEVGTYHWLASVQAKGEDARTHVGMTVQRAIGVMQGFGLNPFAYGFICFDEWEAEEPAMGIDGDGNECVVSIGREAGNRYGFRMDQLNMFIGAGLEYRLSKLENPPS